MNLYDMEESVWRLVGKHDTSQRMNCDRQEIRDGLNYACQDLAMSLSLPSTLRREGTLSIVPGTATYDLDDWVAYPLDFKVVGESDDWRLDGVNPQRGYMESGRYNVQGPDGPREFLTGPRSSANYYENTLNGTVAEGATSITVASATATSALIGRRLRFQGETGDYRVTAVGSTTSITVDREIRARMTGRSATGNGGGYASGTRIEVGPIGCIQITTRPIPTTAHSWKYLYIKKPQVMLNTYDVPEIAEPYHEAIVKGAAARYLEYLGQVEKAQIFEGQANRSIDKMLKRDKDDLPDRSPVRFARTNFGWNKGRNFQRWGNLPPGTDAGN